ncbi:Uncharacterised protein [Vibrio cholerae]|nr:Uncharacterised protein [Vibrio cholerae]
MRPAILAAKASLYCCSVISIAPSTCSSINASSKAKNFGSKVSGLSISKSSCIRLHQNCGVLNHQ